MGVIKWNDRVTYADEILQVGSFGGVDVCSVILRADQWSLLLFHSFPGGQGKIWDKAVPCFSQADAQTVAENALEEFLEEIGFVPKAEFNEARRSAKVFIAELREAEAVGKRRYDEIRDLRAENAVLKERIGSAFGDIDDAIAALKRKVDDIVADTGVARSYSWDVPVDEWWRGAKPKQSTAVDLGNADIDANGYVTFRDGGAA